MAAFSNYLEDKVLDHVFGGTTLSQPANVYLALFTAAPSDAGGGTEVSGGAYARVAITFGASSGGTKSNSADIDFAQATANWGTITHVGIFDAASAGNLLAHGALSASKTVNNGDTFSIPTGSLDVSLD